MLRGRSNTLLHLFWQFLNPSPPFLHLSYIWSFPLKYIITPFFANLRPPPIYLLLFSYTLTLVLHGSRTPSPRGVIIELLPSWPLMLFFFVLFWVCFFCPLPPFSLLLNFPLENHWCNITFWSDPPPHFFLTLFLHRPRNPSPPSRCNNVFERPLMQFVISNIHRSVVSPNMVININRMWWGHIAKLISFKM